MLKDKLLGFLNKPKYLRSKQGEVHQEKRNY